MPLSSVIQNYVDRNIISLERADNLCFRERFILNSAVVRSYIADGTITFEQALDLNFSQLVTLESGAVRDCIADHTIPFAQALALTSTQRSNLESDVVRGYIADGTITFRQALALTDNQRYNLESDEVRGYIAAGTITFIEALALTNTQFSNLESAEVRGYIAAGTITFIEALALTDTQRCNLRSAVVRDFIADRTITFAQALALTYNHRTALDDLETRRRLRDGEIDIEDIMGGHAPHHAHAGAVVIPNINDGQSTHNASVHQTVSESATRLYDRYKSMIDGPKLNQVILNIQAFANGLSSLSETNNAAKRCVLRITDPYYTFTDPGSQITTRVLLALSFTAIDDANVLLGDLNDAKARFIEALYEIQRGYNLSNTGLDQGGEDIPICSAGTFNKLIEKLQGIHPDCQIRFITRETASLKLPIVAREEAMRYITSLASPNTLDELHAFTHLISQVKENGIDVILDHIKATIANRMFDEFGGLYSDRDDIFFTGLMDACQYTDLPDLSIFQAQVQNSIGYHIYCSQLLRQSGFFSSLQKSSVYLSEHRHDNIETQKKYDQ